MKPRIAALLLVICSALSQASDVSGRLGPVNPGFGGPAAGAGVWPALLMPVYFGTEDTIREIQPIPGTNFFLCHKHHSYYFLGGLYLSDDGYVLREKATHRKPYFYDPSKAERYVPLTSEKIAELQQAGILPNPLPGYSIPVGDYIAGYSLWLFLMLVVALGFVRVLLGRLWDWYTAPKP
jgi:hypothetical protein